MNQVRISQPSIPEYGYRFGPGVFNQNMATAQSEGDQRYNLKQFDRAGLSRGGAARQAAASKGGAAVAEGVAQAYGQRAQGTADMANMAMQSQVDQERMAQALANLQAQQRNQQMGALLGLI